MFFNEKEYKEYLKKNKINRGDFERNNTFRRNFHEQDKNGRIIIDMKKSTESAIDISNYSTPKGWYMLDNMDMVLVKNIFGDIYRNLNEEKYNFSKYNAIIIQYLSKQFGIKSAKYYLATEKGNTRLTYIITPSFLNKDEKLVEGNSILKDPMELNIDKILKQIEEYGKEKNYNIEDIVSIKHDFLKQTIFNKFVMQSDENNGNWAIIEDKINAKFSPIYDYDCSCGVETKNKHLRSTNNGSTELKDVLEQYKDEKWLQKYVKRAISKVDFDKIIDNIEDDGIKIEEKVLNRYRKFSNERKVELEKSYNDVYEQKEVEER